PLQSHSRRFWFRYKADTGLAESAEHHVALIRSILDGDEEGAAKDAKKLMALLRGHAEVAATR
ncbi:MAG: GntR family transcriptional regulator, partial [Mesorhizobium sp.]